MIMIIILIRPRPKIHEKETSPYSAKDVGLVGNGTLFFNKQCRRFA
jgi:hypothetical protein